MTTPANPGRDFDGDVPRQPENASETEPVRLTAWIRGRVQGVGFRWWTRSRALELGLAGWARNASDGRVEVVAEGPRRDCDALLRLLRSSETPGSVEDVIDRFSPAKGGLSGFSER
ncbi:acylphosphatase [Cryptosporangium phraense]|uniref:Acylphosphatase n=1 Tax=Cryptosporangium phraense TaxID=2593070 RepID=A0A545ASH8_9ACTN|nr:acylphosphatase [Cryptosporangium phraense]